jgi:multidrug transporter EmrE-like cation transporter
MTYQERIMGYLFIASTILLTVYGQIVIKWQVGLAGSVPISLDGRVAFIARLLFNPWVISSLIAAFLAFLCWIGAITKFQLSYAYPFTSLSFVLVLFLSAILFREAVTIPKVLGMIFIIIGIVVGSQG